MRILLLFVFGLFAIEASAELCEDTLWTYTHQSNASNIGFFADAEELENGDFFAVGQEGTGTRLILARLNADGDTIWTRVNVGGSGRRGFDVCPTLDGGCAVAGNQFNQSGFNVDFFVLVQKYTSAGSLQWTFTSNLGAADASAQGVAELDDSTLIACCTRTVGNFPFDDSEIRLLHLDAAGSQIDETVYTFGGDQSASDFIRTADDGFAISGFRGSDAILIRADSNTDTIWTRVFSDTSIQRFNGITEASDGGIVCVGTTDEFDIFRDGLIVKYDASGNLLWSVVNGVVNFSDIFSDVVETEDGGYLVLGNNHQTGDYVWLIKYSSAGVFEWEAFLLSSGNTDPFAISRASEQGYIIAGTVFGAPNLIRTGPDILPPALDVVEPNGDECFIVGETDSILWSASDSTDNVRIELDRNYPSGLWELISASTPNDGVYIHTWTNPLSYNSRIRITSIEYPCSKDTSDGNFGLVYQGPDTLWTNRHDEGTHVRSYRSIEQFSGADFYVLSGVLDSSGAAPANVLVAIVDENGDVTREYQYGGAQLDEGVRALRDEAEEYDILATTNSFGLSSQIWLIHANEDGDTVWTRTYGGASTESAIWFERTNDGGFIILGKTASFGAGAFDFYVIKTDENGSVENEQTFGGTLDDHAVRIIRTDDGGYLAIGNTSSFGSTSIDLYAVKMNEDLEEQWSLVDGHDGTDIIRDVVQLSDGSYACTGIWGGDNEDILLFSLSEDGEAGDFVAIDRGEREFATRLFATGDGYVIAGSMSPSTIAQQNCFLLKINNSGNVMWTREYGLVSSSCFDAEFSQPSENFLLAGDIGTANKDGYLIRIGQELIQPCPAVEELLAIANEDTGLVTLTWIPPQSGFFDVYSHAGNSLPLPPPGNGWTFEETVWGASGLRIYRDYSTGAEVVKVFRVILNCP